MKIFISWSGNRSRAVAEALHDWLSRVIQAVEPFYTPYMEKGVKWSNEIDEALEGTRFGIVCLTPDNLHSDWIHYETGALSKTKDAVIYTFLHGLVAGDVPQPLGRFQHTVAEKEDVLKLLHSINSRLREVGTGALKDSLLEEIFEETWAKFDAKLQVAESLAQKNSPEEQINPVKIRDEKDVLNEILEAVRNQQRQINELDEKVQRVLPKSKDLSHMINNEIKAIQADESKWIYNSVNFIIKKSPHYPLSDIDIKNRLIKICPTEARISILEEDAGFAIDVDFPQAQGMTALGDFRETVSLYFGSRATDWEFQQ